MHKRNSVISLFLLFIFGILCPSVQAITTAQVVNVTAATVAGFGLVSSAVLAHTYRKVCRQKQLKPTNKGYFEYVQQERVRAHELVTSRKFFPMNFLRKQKAEKFLLSQEVEVISYKNVARCIVATEAALLLACGAIMCDYYQRGKLVKNLEENKDALLLEKEIQAKDLQKVQAALARKLETITTLNAQLATEKEKHKKDKLLKAQEHAALLELKKQLELKIEALKNQLDEEDAAFDQERTALLEKMAQTRDALELKLQTLKEQLQGREQLFDGELEAKDLVIEQIEEQLNAALAANEQYELNIKNQKAAAVLQRALRQQQAAKVAEQLQQQLEAERQAKVLQAEEYARVAAAALQREAEILKKAAADEQQLQEFLQAEQAEKERAQQEKEQLQLQAAQQVEQLQDKLQAKALEQQQQVIAAQAKQEELEAQVEKVLRCNEQERAAAIEQHQQLQKIAAEEAEKTTEEKEKITKEAAEKVQQLEQRAEQLNHQLSDERRDKEAVVADKEKVVRQHEAVAKENREREARIQELENELAVVSTRYEQARAQVMGAFQVPAQGTDHVVVVERTVFQEKVNSGGFSCRSGGSSKKDKKI